MMEYKGYTVKPEIDESVMRLHGAIYLGKDMLVVEGVNPKEFRDNFHELVDDYLEECEAEGVEPHKQYSGKFVIRTPIDLHASLAAQAEKQKRSLNDYVIQLLYSRTGMAMKRGFEVGSKAKLVNSSTKAKKARSRRKVDANK